MTETTLTAESSSLQLALAHLKSLPANGELRVVTSLLGALVAHGADDSAITGIKENVGPILDLARLFASLASEGTKVRMLRRDVVALTEDLHKQAKQDVRVVLQQYWRRRWRQARRQPVEVPPLDIPLALVETLARLRFDIIYLPPTCATDFPFNADWSQGWGIESLALQPGWVAIERAQSIAPSAHTDRNRSRDPLWDELHERRGYNFPPTRQISESQAVQFTTLVGQRLGQPTAVPSLNEWAVCWWGFQSTQINLHPLQYTWRVAALVGEWCRDPYTLGLEGHAKLTAVGCLDTALAGQAGFHPFVPAAESTCFVRTLVRLS